MTGKSHIVLVEDDAEISRLLSMLLETEGFECSCVFRGDEAVSQILSVSPAAVILDIMLPGMNGIQVCEALRDGYSGPIIMLTGSDDDISEIASFAKGADDFVRKPFKPPILLARLHALLRRHAADQVASDCVVTHSLTVWLQRREADVAGQLLDLTSSEFDLLGLLASHLVEVVSREACCQSLRGFDYDGFDRSIDMKISGLRKKLAEADANTAWIKTIRGKGYLLIKAPQIHV